MTDDFNITNCNVLLVTACTCTEGFYLLFCGKNSSLFETAASNTEGLYLVLADSHAGEIHLLMLLNKETVEYNRTCDTSTKTQSALKCDNLKLSGKSPCCDVAEKILSCGCLVSIVTGLSSETLQD